MNPSVAHTITRHCRILTEVRFQLEPFDRMFLLFFFDKG